MSHTDAFGDTFNDGHGVDLRQGPAGTSLQVSVIGQGTYFVQGPATA